jgi:hypothetical protein
MPKWCRTGRQGSRPSVISSISSSFATAYLLMEASSARVAATYRAEYAHRGDDLFSLRSREPRGSQVLLELRRPACARVPFVRRSERA